RHRRLPQLSDLRPGLRQLATQTRVHRPDPSDLLLEVIHDRLSVTPQQPRHIRCVRTGAQPLEELHQDTSSMPYRRSQNASASSSFAGAPPASTAAATIAALS